MRSSQIVCSLTCGLLFLVGRAVLAEESVGFNRDIRPILSNKCFQCHGPDKSARQANLRLDIAEHDDGPFHVRDGGQAIKPRDPEASLIWQRIKSGNADEVMPPKHALKKPLTDAQKELIRRWIQQGAPYEEFWSFLPPRQQTVPGRHDDIWSSQRIDRFVMARLQKDGLMPRARADRRTLIRRVTFDLTGLPPTLDEVHNFLNDTSPDAWEHLVDRLMASPHFGEHMAKYWLDLVRFADTNGIHHDHYRELTPYRDWVIRSFNDNLKYDDFVKFQIAGDLYESPTIGQQIATAFNRLHLVIDVGTALPEESFARNVVDRVTAVGTAFLGLTVGCAVCHDHKYDPFTQKDFYQMYAFFNNDEATPETPSFNTDEHKLGVHAPYLRLSTPEQDERLKSFEAEVAAAASRVSFAGSELKQLRTADRTSEGELAMAEAALRQAEEQLASLKEDKLRFEKQIPVTLVMREREEIRPAHILIRGAYDRPGAVVERNTPSFLPQMPVRDGLRTRMDLADWLTDKSNPLTARVAVNRFWQQIFGVGLVKTSEDFGIQGEWPSHPELLDDLAIQFMESGWDVKALVRSFVMSETWAQSSVAAIAAYQSDPDNRLLARGHRRRLDAEMIRDQILVVSGQLNRQMYGRSVKPPQPANLWKSVSMKSSSTFSFEADTGDKIYRRSLYTFWKRAMPPPQMSIFDAPTRETCIARRDRTNTPLQALVLMNETEYFKASRHLAQASLSKPGFDDTQRLSFLWETVTSRLPDEVELSSLQNGLNAFRKIFLEDEAAREALTVDLSSLNSQERVEVAAYTMLVNSLLNLDIVRSRE